MFVRLSALSGVCAVALLSGAVTAAAFGHADVILGFGQRYGAPDGSGALHRGVDVAADAGSGVTAPVSGTVSFAGRVPAADGGSVLAVTVVADEGRVTISPLSALAVAKGDRVSNGDEVGTLAASGDSSSDAPHVHLSLRVEDMYVDPSILLDAAPADAPAEPAFAPAPASAPVANPGAVVRARSGAVSSPHGELAPGVTLAVRGVLTVPTPQTEPATPVQHSAAAQVAPGVSVLPASVSPVKAEPPRPGPDTRLTPIAWGAIGVAVAAVAAAVWVVFMLLAKRAVRARVLSDEPVSDRFGTMLQHMRSGDTLRGLTSCSGFSPSQSRGRLAQRR